MTTWHHGDVTIAYNDTSTEDDGVQGGWAADSKARDAHSPTDRGQDPQGCLGSQPILFVHGHPFDRSLWRPQARFLAALGHRVIRPDLRGYGASTGPDEVRTLDVFAGDLALLLDHLQLTDVVVCGLSMGGQIALEFVRLFPQRVAALILASTTARADTAEGASTRYRHAEQVLAEGMDGYVAGLLPKMISAQTMTSRPEVAVHVLAMMRGTPPAGAAAALRGRAQRPDYVGLLSRITAPTLLVAGDQDEFTPVPDAELMHRHLPDSRLTVIHGAGHLPNLERPAEFNDAVAGFLASLRQPESAATAAALTRTEIAP